MYGTIASQFNDPGMNRLYRAIMDALVERTGADLTSAFELTEGMTRRSVVIPPERTRYLAEIADDSRKYDEFVDQQCALARQMYQLSGTIGLLRKNVGQKSVEVVEPGEGGVVTAIEHVAGEPEYLKDLIDIHNDLEGRLDPDCAQGMGLCGDNLYKMTSDLPPVRHGALPPGRYATGKCSTAPPSWPSKPTRSYLELIRGLALEGERPGPAHR